VLSDGQEVKFTGVKSPADREHEACAIRADHPMPPQCGIYYFEVTIISRRREEYVSSFCFVSQRPIQVFNTHIGAPLVLASQVKAYHYRDYQDGNLNHGHITEMTDTHSVAKAQASITDHHSQQAIS